MEIFKTSDEMVNAILTCKDEKERKAALSVAVKFVLHDKSIVRDDNLAESLANKVMLTLLMLAIESMGKPKGGE